MAQKVGRTGLGHQGRIARTRPPGRDQVSMAPLSIEYDLMDKTDRADVSQIVTLVTGGGGGTPATHTIALLMPFEFSVGGSPITNNGTFLVAWGVQGANELLAGPISGPAGTPGFRLQVNPDLPYRSQIRIDPTTVAPTVTPDASTSSQFSLVADQNFTLNPPANGLDGQKVTVRITQDGTGGRLWTLDSNIRYSTYLTSAFCTLTTTPGATDYLGLEKNEDAGPNTWDIIAFVPGVS